jgi:hypothetical protein
MSVAEDDLPTFRPFKRQRTKPQIRIRSLSPAGDAASSALLTTQDGGDASIEPSIRHARKSRAQPRGIGFVTQGSRTRVSLTPEPVGEPLPPESIEDAVAKRFVAQQGARLITSGDADRHMLVSTCQMFSYEYKN